MNTRKLMVFTLLIAATLASCTSTPPPPPEASSSAAIQEGVPGGVFVNTVDVSARVTAIDQTTRKVTLVNSDGSEFTAKVGPEAVNFDQVKVGDMVKLTVTEELVVSLADEQTSQPDAAAGVVALAPKGARPGGVIAATERVTGTVSAIDHDSHTATLKFENGATETFPVRSDVDLSQHKVGEKVVFHITEMVALSVEKQ